MVKLSKRFIITCLGGVAVIAVGLMVLSRTKPVVNQFQAAGQSTPATDAADLSAKSSQSMATEFGQLVSPTNEFVARVTKKRFGTKVSPADSPVQPERFSGYHTGVDAEFGDVTGDVAVYAIASGEVVLARRVNGYGGAVMARHTIGGAEYNVVYGHLDLARLPSVGAKLVAGQVLAYLGEAGPNTDGERKHLHFHIAKPSADVLLGYVKTKSELEDWIDPLTLY